MVLRNSQEDLRCYEILVAGYGLEKNVQGLMGHGVDAHLYIEE
jgi:hypothetical protein